jgi:hypothetical protein
VWCRLGCEGVTQDIQDKFRRVIPDVIPAHQAISNGKKSILEKIEKNIGQIKKTADGYAIDFRFLAKFLATYIKHTKEKYNYSLSNNKILLCFSYDAKYTHRRHITEWSVRVLLDGSGFQQQQYLLTLMLTAGKDDAKVLEANCVELRTILEELRNNGLEIDGNTHTHTRTKKKKKKKKKMR